MRNTYKYYAGVTSQLAFCSTPLRLDAYNRCQYSCAYCYASTRQGFGRDSSLQIANPNALRKRFERVSQGKIASALDEFIQHRIPFQLGGMSDPFTIIESREGVTLEYLKILKEYDYPVILSTKSDMLSQDEYLSVISDSNAYVRFSTTVISPRDRYEVDRGCPDIAKLMMSASELDSVGVPVSLRFQPIIPGHEHYAVEMIEMAKKANVKHISAEYLKVPIDADKNFGSSLKTLLGGSPIASYKERGATLQGREYTLPLSYREGHLIDMALLSRSYGITFGFADNELLIHSDGNSCCNASDLYLKNASFFDANIVSKAKTRKSGEPIFFSDFLDSWIPKKSISTYLNSKARISLAGEVEPEWIIYLKKMWEGEHGLYSPCFFDGITKSSSKDEFGLPIYFRTSSDFENKYQLKKNINKTAFSDAVAVAV